MPNPAISVLGVGAGAGAEKAAMTYEMDKHLDHGNLALWEPDKIGIRGGGTVHDMSIEHHVCRGGAIRIVPLWHVPWHGVP